VPNVPAATGTDLFAITTFAGQNESGAVVSSGVETVTVTGNGTVDATVGGSGTLSLGGYVNAIVISVVPNAFISGVPSQAQLVIIPQDAAGATIIGNAQFAYPILITVSGSGFTLSGPGLQSNGSIVLQQPQSIANVLAFSGAATSGTITASTQTADGTPVTATLTLGPAPPTLAPGQTPSPTPTPTLAPGQTPVPPPTLPPSPTATPVPTPMPSLSAGQTPPPTPTPTAVPATSVYVLNGNDNTIAEFSEPASGTYATTPRRVFGGATVGCPSNVTESLFGLSDVSIDASGDIIAATNGTSCNPSIAQTYYVFNAAAVGSSPPAAQYTDPNQYYNYTLEFDPTRSQYDTNSNGLFRQIQLSGSYSLMDNLPSNPMGCFLSPGLPNGNPSSPCHDDTDGGYFSFYGDTGLGVAPDGGLIAFVVDNASSNLGYIRVSPANQVQGPQVEADPAWIEGSNDPIAYDLSAAVDQNNVLWILDFGNPAIDGYGNAYLAAFDLSALTGQSGPQNLTPIAIIGGETVGRFEDIVDDPYSYQPPGNALYVANNRIYVANETGPVCDSNCQNGTPVGEVDVYDATLRGVHVNDAQSAPLAVIYGSYVRGPIGVVDAPHGSATGTGGLVRMRGTRYVNPAFYAWRERMRALQRQGAQRQLQHFRRPW
jgi:hypothetical protein